MNIKKTLEIISENSKLISKLNVKEVIKLLNYCNKYYYSFNEPKIPDVVYDKLKNRLRKLEPDNKLLLQTGIKTKNEVELPFYMPSLDKVGDDKSLNKFLNSIIVLEDKHDGLSIAITNENNQWNIYSRGRDGIKGQNLTHLVPYLNLPKLKAFNNLKPQLKIRAEIQLREDIFKKYFEGATSRNTLSGFFTRKENFKNLKHASIIAYQLITITNNEEIILKPEQQLKNLKNILGFQVPYYKVINSNRLSFEKLKKYLELRKSKCKYKIDGLVLIYNKKYKLPKTNNPKYSVKFKLNFEYKTTEVLDVIWQESQYKKLSPVIRLKPVTIDGVKISKVTGFNFKFIKDNGIGKGAIVRVCRSGDVIPDLRSEDVLKSVDPSLPSIEYTLSETKVHAYSVKTNDTIKIKKIDKYFRSLKVDEFSIGRIKRIFDAGFNTIPKILKMSIADISSIKGFNIKSASTIYNNIHNVKKVDITTLMIASSIFNGFYEARLYEIVTNNRDKFINKEKLELKDITKLKGFKDKLSDSFIKNLPKFYKFMSKLEKYYEIEIPKLEVYEGILNKVKIVFTGFRDKDFNNFVTRNGGTLSSTVNSSTGILVRVDSTYDNKKTEKATNLNIPIVNKDEFFRYVINNY